MFNVLLPAANESMQTGTVTEWMCEDGDVVERGQPIVEIETDKVSFEIDAEHAGVLRLLIDEGETVSVGTVIAQIETMAL